MGEINEWSQKGLPSEKHKIRTVDDLREYEAVIERFNAAHAPKVKAQIIKTIEYGVTMYTVTHHGFDSAFVVCKRTPEEFEQRLNETFEAIERMDEEEEEETEEEREKEILRNCVFLSNSYYADPSKYPKYDNYDAINVDKVADIPYDYDGLIGVPITVMDKYNPEQFEIVDMIEPVINGQRKYKRFVIRKKRAGENLFVLFNGK